MKYHIWMLIFEELLLPPCSHNKFSQVYVCSSIGQWKFMPSFALKPVYWKFSTTWRALYLNKKKILHSLWIRRSSRDDLGHYNDNFYMQRLKKSKNPDLFFKQVIQLMLNTFIHSIGNRRNFIKCINIFITFFTKSNILYHI